MRQLELNVSAMRVTALLTLLLPFAAPAGARAGAKPERGTKEAREMSSEQKEEVAVLAGGCFWGMEHILRSIPGVISTEVGYSGGTFQGPRYDDVKSGRTGHAESVQVVFDPSKLSYEALLGWFFRMHDPTTKNRQGDDFGTQYRSAIFYFDETQRQTAEKVKAAVEKSGKWPQPLATEIVPAGAFYPAEDAHQDFLVKNPGGYTCHWVRE
jgi:methionine-S-sulfoxide reductase